MFDDAETTIYYERTMPDTVNYIRGSKGVGPAGNTLELSLYSLNPEIFYKMHCVCSGAYAANNLYKDLNFVPVFINPNTGKLVDIQHINYPYYNGEKPTTW